MPEQDSRCPDNSFEVSVDFEDLKVNYSTDKGDKSQSKSIFASASQDDRQEKLNNSDNSFSGRLSDLEHISIAEETSVSSCTKSLKEHFCELDACREEIKENEELAVECKMPRSPRSTQAEEVDGTSAEYLTNKSDNEPGGIKMPNLNLDISETSELHKDDNLNVEVSKKPNMCKCPVLQNEWEIWIDLSKEPSENLSYPGYHLRAGGSGDGHPFGCVTLVRASPYNLNSGRPELGDRSNNIRNLVDDLKGRIKEIRDSIGCHAVDNLHYLRDINFKQMGVVDNIEQHNTNEQERIVFEQRQSGVKYFDPHPVEDEFYSIQWKQQNIDKTLAGCTEVRECDERDFRRISQPVGYHCFTPCPCPVKGLQFADGRDDIKGEEMYSRHRKHHSFGQFNDGSGCFENRESDDVDLKRRAAGSQVTLEHPMFPTHNCCEGIEYSFDFDKNCGSEEIYGQHKQQVSVGQSHSGYYSRNDKNCDFIRTSRPDPYQPVIPDPGYPPPFPPFYSPGYPVYSLSPTNPCQYQGHVPPCAVPVTYYPVYEHYNPYDTYEFHQKHRHIDKNESGSIDVSEEHHTRPCPPPSCDPSCCDPPCCDQPAGKDTYVSPRKDKPESSSLPTSETSDQLRTSQVYSVEIPNHGNTSQNYNGKLYSIRNRAPAGAEKLNRPSNCSPSKMNQLISPRNCSPEGTEKLNCPSNYSPIKTDQFISPRNYGPEDSDKLNSPSTCGDINANHLTSPRNYSTGENILPQNSTGANTTKFHFEKNDCSENIEIPSPQCRSPAGEDKPQSPKKKVDEKECPENKIPEDAEKEECPGKQKEFLEYPNPKWQPPCKYRDLPEPFPKTNIDFEPGEDYSRHTKCRSVDSTPYGCLDVHETEQLEERRVVPHFVYCPYKPLPPCPPCYPCPFPPYCPDQVFPTPKEEGPYDEEDEERFLKHMRYREVGKSRDNCMNVREVELMDERTQYKVCNPCCVDEPEPDPNCKLPNEPPKMKSQFGVPDPDDVFGMERYTMRSRYRSVDKTDEGCLDVIEKEHREDKRYLPVPCDKGGPPPPTVRCFPKEKPKKPCPPPVPCDEPEMVPFPDELFTQFSKSRSAGRTCQGFYDCIEKENRESVRLIQGWQPAEQCPSWDSPERFLPSESSENNSSQDKSSGRFKAGSDSYNFEKVREKAGESLSESYLSTENASMLKSPKNHHSELTSSNISISSLNQGNSVAEDINESCKLCLSPEKSKLKQVLTDSNNSAGSDVQADTPEDFHEYISLRGGGLDDSFNYSQSSGFHMYSNPFKNYRLPYGWSFDREGAGSDRYNTGQESYYNSGAGCSTNSEGSPNYQYQSPCDNLGGNAGYSDQDGFDYSDGCGINDVVDCLKEEIKRLRRLNEETLATISCQNAPPLVKQTRIKKNLHCYINKLVTEVQPDVNEILRKRIIEGVLEFVNSNSSWLQLNLPPEEEEPGQPLKTVNFQVNGVYKFNRNKLMDDTQGPGLTITGMQIIPPCPDSGSPKSKPAASTSKTKPAEEKDSKSGSRTESNPE